MNRFLSISGWILAVVGFAFSIWAWKDSKQGGYLSYSVDKTLIFQQPRALASIPSPFSNGDPNNQDNALLYDFAFWNSSNVTIRSEDIRSNLSISFSGGSEIINHKVVNSAGGIEDNFKIEVAGDRVIIGWKLLDPTAGARFVVLVRNPGAQPSVTGNFGPAVKVEEYRGQPYKNFFTAESILVGFFFASFLTPLMKKIDKHTENEKKNWRMAAFYLVCMVVVVVICFFLLAGPGVLRVYGYMTDTPPPQVLVGS